MSTHEVVVHFAVEETGCRGVPTRGGAPAWDFTGPGAEDRAKAVCRLANADRGVLGFYQVSRVVRVHPRGAALPGFCGPLAR